MSRNAPNNSLAGYAFFWIGCGLFFLSTASGSAESFSSVNSPPSARVVIASNPEATSAFVPRPTVVKEMINRAITNFANKGTVPAAWLSLVSTQDIVGIKVYSTPGVNSGTRPAVVAGVVEGLLSAGIPSNHIVIWDKQAADLRLAEYYDLAKKYQVLIASSAQAGYDQSNSYDSAIIGSLVYGDVEFGLKNLGTGRKSFVSKLVSQGLTKIINIAPLLNHNLAGVSGNLYSLAMGSVDNFARFEADSSRLSTAVPEIYNLPALSDHVVLNIVDALICQYEGGERGYLHYSTTLNELRFSKDPVALDVLSLQELERQRAVSKAPAVKTNFDLYNNAALLELGVSDPKRIEIERVE